MENTRVIDDDNAINKIDGFENETHTIPDNTNKAQPEDADNLNNQTLQTNLAALSSASKKYTDEELQHENSFSYFDSNNVNVQLHTGNFQYETTDFILPGKDGFDLTIGRRYDSGRANQSEMDLNITIGSIKTSGKSNSFDNKTYGLGYGWSFILPSIETVAYKYCFSAYYDYSYLIESFMHLEDGRTITLKDYKLEDFKIIDKSGTLYHPSDPSKKTSYKRCVEHKNGNKDYYTHSSRELTTWKVKYTVYDYKLVAREDRFGNMIFFDIAGNGEMTIVDTWARTISLKWDEHGALVWTLPKAADGSICTVSYCFEDKEDQTEPRQLASVKNLLGLETTYSYNQTKSYTGEMKCAADNDEFRFGEAKRKYMLLENIKYPNQSETRFTYGDKLEIQNKSGGYIRHFPLAMKTDVYDNVVYNQVKYSYERSSTYDYIEKAFVKRHNEDMKETYKFSEEGLLDWKEVEDKSILVSKSNYTYDENKLMLTSSDEVYKRGDTSKLLKKTITYTWDNKANITREVHDYPEDPTCNQDITTSYYDDYNIIKTIIRKKGNDTIKETNEVYANPRHNLIKCHRIFEQDILKQKTVYEYNNSEKPNSITQQKQYYTLNNGDLDASNQYVETCYEYDNNQYTHKCAAKEITGIKDADAQSLLSIKERYSYDNWGRLISKTDANGQTNTFSYDKLGRLTEEKLPIVNGVSNSMKTSYHDVSCYITKTDANGYKRRIYYTPFGKVSRVCLAVTDTPMSEDIVLQDFHYNAWGELEVALTYDGYGTAAGNVKKREEYTYDSFGRVKSLFIPQTGYKESYRYEEVFIDQSEPGEKKYFCEQKTISGDSFSPKIETMIYKNQDGQVRKEFLAGERTATYEYDNAGNMIRKVDAYGKEERLEYDYAGQVVKSLRKDAEREQKVCFEYDALGNKRFSWEEDDKKTEFKYDHAGRLIETIAPFDTRSQKVRYYYDGVGNLIKEKNAQTDGWQEVQYIYDARSRLTDTYQYLDSNNWIRTVYEYDVLDNVIKMRAGDTPSGIGREVTTYTYDRFGNVLTKTDARGCREVYQYDKIGRLQEKTDRNGNRTIYQYDAMERLIKETAYGKTIDETVVSEREYEYSVNGKLTREVSRETIDGSQTVTLETGYYYNEKGQLSRQEDPGHVIKEYVYDIYGNRQSFKLTRNGQSAPEVHLCYQYDDLYRLKQVRRNSLNGPILADYEYDIRGNRKALRYPQTGIETSYTYNNGNRIESLVSRRQGVTIAAWNYSYDIDGNMISKTDMASSPSIKITYRYDRLGRLTEEHNPGWKRTIYTYDEYSNRVCMKVEGKSKDELVSVTKYDYGLNNWLEKEEKKQGKVTETYQYCYDANGNETFRIWEKTAPTPDYPGTVKLSGGRKKDFPTVYEWRHYNGFNQLIRVNQDEKEIMYQYRGDGLRHSRYVRELTEREGKTNVICWDGSDIVAEQTDGEGVKRYLRGTNLIAGDANGMVYYYIHNEHGDVAQLRSAGGTCKGSYEYDGDIIGLNQKTFI